MKTLSLLLIITSFISVTAWSQNDTSNTLSYNDSIDSPIANLNDVAWIQGHWQGEAFGGIAEEIWTPPLGNSMMGAFKLNADGQVRFYELMTISEIDKTLLLQIKHFDADLKGWEEKDESIEFKLVKITAHKVFFDGLTFEKLNDNEINVYVVIHHDKDDTMEEVKFHYSRP